LQATISHRPIAFVPEGSSLDSLCLLELRYPGLTGTSKTSPLGYATGESEDFRLQKRHNLPSRCGKDEFFFGGVGSS